MERGKWWLGVRKQGPHRSHRSHRSNPQRHNEAVNVRMHAWYQACMDVLLFIELGLLLEREFRNSWVLFGVRRLLRNPVQILVQA